MFIKEIAFFDIHIDTHVDIHLKRANRHRPLDKDSDKGMVIDVGTIDVERDLDRDRDIEIDVDIRR